MQAYFSIKKFTFLALVVLVCINCSSDDDAVISYDLTGSWRVVAFTVEGTTITKTAENTWPDFNNGDITAILTEPNAEGEGEITGFTVTNAYNGTYTIQEGGEIAIGPVATTFINEPEWTQYYKISGAEQYEIRNEKLFIYYNNKSNTIVLERL
ncbi:MAG: META domain-containing protein [Bacteroidota bacterium]